MDTVRESRVERRLVDGCRKAGAQAWKFTSPGRAGVPDRIVLLPGGRIIFVELKTTKGTVTKLQQQTHNLLRGYGFDVRVLHGPDEVGSFLEEVQHCCKGGMPGAV